MDRIAIRYHPLIDCDTAGTEKVPMFVTTEGDVVKKTSKLYLSEVVPNHYRFYSKEPMSSRISEQLVIHCPLCGSNLKQIAENSTTKKLGLYTCMKCKDYRN